MAFVNGRALAHLRVRAARCNDCTLRRRVNEDNDGEEEGRTAVVDLRAGVMWAIPHVLVDSSGYSVPIRRFALWIMMFPSCLFFHSVVTFLPITIVHMPVWVGTIPLPPAASACAIATRLLHTTCSVQCCALLLDAHTAHTHPSV